jgi:hypothetical protein
MNQLHLPPGTDFQQDGVPARYSHIVRNHVNYMLPCGWISIGISTALSAMSPDSIGYFPIWDCLEPYLPADKQ